MNRREQIRQGMSGGTTAPNGRRAQLRAALAPRQPKGPNGRSEFPGTLPPPKRFPQVGGGGVQRAANIGGSSGFGDALKEAQNRFSQVQPQGVSGAIQPRLGAQLSQRVKSGVIDQAQAEKTARQRQTLKKAFGSDWRSKVYAGGGAREIREGGPFASRQIAAERAKGLARARRKLY